MSLLAIVALSAVGFAIAWCVTVAVVYRRNVRRLRAQNAALRDAFAELMRLAERVPEPVRFRIRYGHLLGGLPTDMFSPRRGRP